LRFFASSSKTICRIPKYFRDARWYGPSLLSCQVWCNSDFTHCRGKGSSMFLPTACTQQKVPVFRLLWSRFSGFCPRGATHCTDEVKFGGRSRCKVGRWLQKLKILHNFWAYPLGVFNNFLGFRGSSHVLKFSWIRCSDFGIMRV